MYYFLVYGQVSKQTRVWVRVVVLGFGARIREQSADEMEVMVYSHDQV